MDYECFGNSILNNISLLDIKDIRDKVKSCFKDMKENFDWLV